LAEGRSCSCSSRVMNDCRPPQATDGGGGSPNRVEKKERDGDMGWGRKRARKPSALLCCYHLCKDGSRRRSARKKMLLRKRRWTLAACVDLGTALAVRQIASAPGHALPERRRRSRGTFHPQSAWSDLRFSSRLARSIVTRRLQSHRTTLGLDTTCLSYTSAMRY
jgi:hypothetical protein